MSSLLLYSPAASNKEYALHHQSKYIIAPLIWEGYDGTEGSPKKMLDSSNIETLIKAKKDAQEIYGDECAKSIQKLINSIKRNKHVAVWLQR